MNTLQRQPGFRKNPALEELLRELNGMLAPVQTERRCEHAVPRNPVVLIVGCPRAGTTLLLQWLARSGRFAYPSNFLSRFYAAPYVGARIQQMLVDSAYRFGDEMAGLTDTSDFDSELGKTRGPWSPNEFWYFWRRFVPHEYPQHLDDAALEKVDASGMAAELAMLEAVFDKPWAMKGLLLQQNASFLARAIERAVFLFVRRDPFFNMQSLLEARERFFGSRDAWYSVKPAEFEWLRELDACAQVAGQVHYVNRGIEHELARVERHRWLEVSYESFCADPAALYDELVGLLGRNGYSLDPTCPGPECFAPAREVRVTTAEREALERAYRSFAEREAGA